MSHSERYLMQVHEPRFQQAEERLRDVFDISTVLNQGAREYQEDAILSEKPIGSDLGFVVLADGMGGHAAGDVASNLIVCEVTKGWLAAGLNKDSSNSEVVAFLHDSAERANKQIFEASRNDLNVKGMGATLLILICIEDRAFWFSVGDSPLYLWRSGELIQLNEDHSMAPQIDMMAKLGMLDPDLARNHPDRNMLTSVIHGGDIAKIDCPSDPFKLLPDDILIAASDGLQFLEDKDIQEVVTRNHEVSCDAIADALIRALISLDDPDQDNIAFSVAKVCS